MLSSTEPGGQDAVAYSDSFLSSSVCPFHLTHIDPSAVSLSETMLAMLQICCACVSASRLATGVGLRQYGLGKSASRDAESIKRALKDQLMPP
jgi:hypothetical protein